ncbi:MAG: DMT family transporter [Actinobacteria bacterium]|nr:DMT family transporter [Actinomycetota bacterium]
MARSYLWMLSFLAAVWGASYLFIKVAVADIEPAPMMFLRLVLAGALLLPFTLVRTGPRYGLAELRRAARPGLALGIVNAALPFTLIAWGEKHIDSGVAAIANATVPLFVVLLAIRFRPSERAKGGRLVGILLGLVGVAVLAGAQPDGGWAAVAGTLAVVVASVSYAAGSLYGQRTVAEISGPVLATASMIGGALVLLPFAAAQVPDAMPGWSALASVAALGVLGTALAQLVLFRMLRLHGSSRTSLVTFLLPPTALLYGALFLDEPLTLAALSGLALILAGVALGSGAARPPWRSAVAESS